MDTSNFNEILSYVRQKDKNISDCEGSIKIHFLRNFTIEPIIPFLKFENFQLGINSIITFSHYDGMRQEVLDPTSYLLTEKPDLVVLSLVYDSNNLFPTSHTDIISLKNDLFNLFEKLAEKTTSMILVNTFIPPFYSSLFANDAEINEFRNYSFINHSIREYVL